jgi:hypothetical protein
MVTLATFKFGIVIAVVVLGALFVAFLGYLYIFGRNSSLNRKNTVQPDDSI